MNNGETTSRDAVMICGLGRLGQHCAVVLKEFGIPVFGLNNVEVAWEVEGVPQAFDRLTIGDCRRHTALEQAGLSSCRAILLTTGDETVNLGAALAARVRSPDVRLVVRSSLTNLNHLLQHRLHNLVALDMAELPATAFALAAMGDETVGLFSVDGKFLRVVEHQIGPTDSNAGTELHRFNTHDRRVLHWTSASDPQPIDFQTWDPKTRIEAGDLIVTIELNQAYLAEQAAKIDPVTNSPKVAFRIPSLGLKGLGARIVQTWERAQRPYRIGAVVAGLLFVIHLAGVILFRSHYPEISFLDAYNVATVLIFDGYSNMFAQLRLPFPIPFWLLFFSLLMTMSGAVATGIMYAFLTARVLSARLHFRRHHGRIPKRDHTIILGSGPVARRVAELLLNLGRPVVYLSEEELDPGILVDVPVITSDPRQAMRKANCDTAASVAVLTKDDMANLEIALTVARTNEHCHLVIRTDDEAFGRNVELLAPHTHTMSLYALSAEACAAASLGQTVISLLRMRGETVLAIEYAVETGDGLAGQLIADVQYGYGLVAILYQRKGSADATFFPSEDIRLEPDSRLVVLATIPGLQNVEHKIARERDVYVRLIHAGSDSAAFEGARTLVRVTGCDLAMARTQMSQLPATFPLGLFGQQVVRLVRELRVAGVEAEVRSHHASRLS